MYGHNTCGCILIVFTDVTLGEPLKNDDDTGDSTASAAATVAKKKTTLFDAFFAEELVAT